MKGEGEGHDVFLETDYRYSLFLRGLRTKNGWKFIYNLETGLKELYNLRADSLEKTDLADENPNKKLELEQKLQKHLDSLK